MGFDRPPLCPIVGDHINPTPKRELDIGSAGHVFEQSHPERGQRFVIEIGNAVMRGEETNLVAHPLQRLVR